MVWLGDQESLRLMKLARLRIFESQFVCAVMMTRKMIMEMSSNPPNSCISPVLHVFWLQPHGKGHSNQMNSGAFHSLLSLTNVSDLALEYTLCNICTKRSSLKICVCFFHKNWVILHELIDTLARVIADITNIDKYENSFKYNDQKKGQNIQKSFIEYKYIHFNIYPLFPRSPSLRPQLCIQFAIGICSVASRKQKHFPTFSRTKYLKKRWKQHPIFMNKATSRSSNNNNISKKLPEKSHPRELK